MLQIILDLAKNEDNWMSVIDGSKYSWADEESYINAGKLQLGAPREVLSAAFQ
jgi:hypothetical protein